MSGMTGRPVLALSHGGGGPPFTAAERGSLLDLERRALRYFLDNQAACGLIRDRQSNRGRLRPAGPCSTSATGMGLIALALASAPPHRLLSRSEAVRRVEAALAAALRLPHEEGIMPHFVGPNGVEPLGSDSLSTIDSGWLLAGALWAASFLDDGRLQDLADELYERVNWRYWSAPAELGGAVLLRHGRGRDGRPIPWLWDRINGETIFLYVLAAGAGEGRAWPASSWPALRPHYGEVAGHRFNNADLGLFVFQYGLDLIDPREGPIGEDLDLMREAAVATAANRDACRGSARVFRTYRQFWGLSAGDGPGPSPTRTAYRAYSPTGPIDGTAQLMAALASIAHDPDAVFANLHAARSQRAHAPLGRYGLSNINLDRRWVGHDMVGIDAGAAVLALENALEGDRVRRIFHGLPSVRRGLARLGMTERSERRKAS